MIVVEMAIIAPNEVLPLHKLSDAGYCGAPNIIRPHLKPGTGPRTYPLSAVRRNEEGATIIDFLVEKDGTVRDVKIPRSSGFSDLDEAAKSATLAEQYYPAMLRNQPVACRKIERIVWKLTDRDAAPNNQPSYVNIRNMGRVDYPPQAAANGEHGTTKIDVVIDENGRISHLEVRQSSGFNDLDMASLNKIYSDRHIVPASLSAKPIKTVAFFEFNWSLAKQSQPSAPAGR
jgi:TonB family protein